MRSATSDRERPSKWYSTRTSPPESEHGGYFSLFAAVAIYGAARVITHARPVYSAVYFVLVVITVAGMTVLL